MAKKYIRCIHDDIPPESLGFTDAHDHLFVFPIRGVHLPDRLLIDDYARTVLEVRAFTAAGGHGVVDAQPVGAGRQPELLVGLWEDTKLNIIASTGMHKRFFYPDDSPLHTYSAGELADLFISEIRTGMYAYDPNTPCGRRTGFKAGIIKIATEENGIDETYIRVFQAAAGAHIETGAPIITHTELSAYGLEQARFLISEGVRPESIIISHMDRTIDYEAVAAVAETGVFLSFDTIGRFQYHSDEDEVRLIAQLWENGFGSRIMLGLDCTRDRYMSYEGTIGLDYLQRVFLPLLVQSGFSKDMTEMLTITNPAKALCFA